MTPGTRNQGRNLLWVSRLSEPEGSRPLTGFKETEKCAAHSERFVAFDETLTKHHGSPSKSEEREPVGASHPAEYNVRWQFKEKVRDEEHDEDNGVPAVDLQLEIGAHARHTSVGDLYS